MSVIVIEEGGCAARHSMKYLQLLFLKLMIKFTVTEKKGHIGTVLNEVLGS